MNRLAFCAGIFAQTHKRQPPGLKLRLQLGKQLHNRFQPCGRCFAVKERLREQHAHRIRVEILKDFCDGFIDLLNAQCVLTASENDFAFKLTVETRHHGFKTVADS